MDHFGMKQAMINALEHKVIELENTIKYLTDINEDTVLVGNSLVECLKIFISRAPTSDDLEYAQDVLKIWNDHYGNPCGDCK